MTDGNPKPAIPLTEPVPVACLFTSGFEIELMGPVVRLIAFVELPTVDPDQPERRIIGRLVMPDGVARGLARDLRKLLSRGGH